MIELSQYTRRSFLRTGMAAAATMNFSRAGFAFSSVASPQECALAAEQEVGPYYVADEMVRSEIAESKPGVPLSLKITLLNLHTCEPMRGAAVDLWHCDARGIYSGYTKQSLMTGPPPGFDPNRVPNGPPPGRMGPPPASHPGDKLTFLRGIQITADDGSVRFRTIFPGFYMGRTNHIHFKVRLGGNVNGHTYRAGHTSHVGQVFFPEEMTVKLMREEPYTLHKIHRTTQDEDGIFGGQHGAVSIATLRMNGSGSSATLDAELVATVDPARHRLR
jgi:protocatechuate 3,4-dioxygenase beta subunit